MPGLESLRWRTSHWWRRCCGPMAPCPGELLCTILTVIVEEGPARFRLYLFDFIFIYGYWETREEALQLI